MSRVERFIAKYVSKELCCEPSKYYTMCLGPCAPPEYVRYEPTGKIAVIWTKCLFFQYVPCEPPKNKKY